MDIGEQRLQVRRQFGAVATGRCFQILLAFEQFTVIIFYHFELHGSLLDFTGEATLQATPLEIELALRSNRSLPCDSASIAGRKEDA